MIDFDRAALRVECRRDEGLRLRVYRCSKGKLSIGIGRNLDDVGISAAETRRLGITVASCIAHGITEAIAYALLETDIDRAIAGLDTIAPWWRRLCAVRQRVLLNMCLNMGAAKLAGFTKMLAAVRVGDWARAKAEMIASAWHGQVGDRAIRLEAMMLTGTA